MIRMLYYYCTSAKCLKNSKMPFFIRYDINVCVADFIYKECESKEYKNID